MKKYLLEYPQSLFVNSLKIIRIILIEKRNFSNQLNVGKCKSKVAGTVTKHKDDRRNIENQAVVTRTLDVYST